MSIVVLRLCSEGPYIGTDDNGNRIVYDPRLVTPIEIGSRINAEQYGQVIRGEINAGMVEVALDEEFWYWLNLGWKGRTIRIKKGNNDKRLENFELLYTGRVDDIEWGTADQKLNIKITDAGLDLDSVLVNELYGDTSLEAIKGKPKPFARGVLFSIEPVLEDEVNQIYRISWGANVEEIMRVSVGGVDWDRSDNFPPGGGEWWSDLASGIFYLGSETEGGEVRVDCKIVGWDSFTSSELMREIVELGGGQIDSVSFSEFWFDAPELVGFYQGAEPINRLNVLDIIANGIGGWWFFGEDEKIRAGVIAAPDISSDFLLTDVEIDDLHMVGILPPAWRIRVEWKRNWQPVNNFFTEVSVVDQQFMQSGGIIKTYQDGGVRIAEPRAVDVPLIRSLVWRETDAERILDRLLDAWGEKRNVYEITAKSDVPRLYSTLEVNFLMVEGFFRLHSGMRSIGGGLSKFQVWGAPNIVATTPVVSVVVEPESTTPPFVDGWCEGVITSADGNNPVSMDLDPLTTTLSDNLIAVFVMNERSELATPQPVTGIDSPSGLIFTRRGGGWGPIQLGTALNIECWTAPAEDVVVGEVLTVNFSPGTGCATVAAVGIHLADLISPLDLGVVPAAHDVDNSGAGPSVTVSTSNAYDLLLWAAGGSTIPANNGAPTGFTMIRVGIASASGFDGKILYFSIFYRQTSEVLNSEVITPSSNNNMGGGILLAVRN